MSATTGTPATAVKPKTTETPAQQVRQKQQGSHQQQGNQKHQRRLQQECRQQQQGSQPSTAGNRTIHRGAYNSMKASTVLESKIKEGDVKLRPFREKEGENRHIKIVKCDLNFAHCPTTGNYQNTANSKTDIYILENPGSRTRRCP